MGISQLLIADIGSGNGPAPPVPDETLRAMNARLSTLMDRVLGFGSLEGSTKQQLTKMAMPPVFTPHTQTTMKFHSLENTSSVEGAMGWEQLIQAAPTGVDLGLGSLGTQTRMAKATIHEKSVVVCHFTRIIAMRSIAPPPFKELLPVKKNQHMDASETRWLVELFGNQICTTEYYGGQAYISFMWDRTAKLSVSEIVSAIETLVADSHAHHRLVQKAQMAELKCSADVKGFALPDDARGNLTSVSSIMQLISALNTLPITCAVPVGSESVPLRMVSGFPHALPVETQIREDEMLENLTRVQLQIEATPPLHHAAREFVVDLKHAIEHASLSNRLTLPRLRTLGNLVVETLAPHGKCVELYDRNGELRLRTDDCDRSDITASATETSAWASLGVALLATRPFQSARFSNAPAWTTPEHFEARQFRNTIAVTGYYDRVKVELLFDGDGLLATWRKQLLDIVSHNLAQSRRRILGVLKW